MDWPTLVILVVTYNRAATLRGTLDRIAEHLWYEGPRQLIVADDGSDDGTPAMLADAYPAAQLVVTARQGLGANTNAGLRAAFEVADCVLQLQDDMWLLNTLDLHPHVARLRDDEKAGFVRLWGVGGHRYTAELEQNHWRVRWDSDELYVPSDRPHLKHRRFHEHFGYYPEALPTAATEDAWCHQCKDIARSRGGPHVLIPLGVDTERSWEHRHWGERWRDRGL